MLGNTQQSSLSETCFPNLMKTTQSFSGDRVTERKQKLNFIQVTRLLEETLTIIYSNYDLRKEPKAQTFIL